jgi:DNA repair exonuclease SbcCD ATPase subunit
VRGIHAVRAALQKEASDIFAPRAQIPPLNKALKTFDEARKRINQLALKPREWQELRKRLQEARESLAERERELGDTLAELSRLQRLGRVLPALRTREALLVQKQELGEIKLTPETCPQERSKAQQVLDDAVIRANRLEEEQARCEQERRELKVPEELLTRESDVEELQKRLGAHLKAKNDLPGLKAKVAAAREEAHAILKALGRRETPEQAEELRIDVMTQKRIHRLGQEGARFETESGRARKDVAAMEQSLRELRRRQEALPAAREVSDLERLLAEINRRGDLQGQLRSLETEIVGFREKADKQLAALLLWQGPLEQVVALPLPPIETIERFRGEFEELANDRRLIENQRDGARKRMEDAAAGIALLESHGAVPSVAEWGRSKDLREKRWQKIRNVWLEEGADDSSSEELAGDYELQVRQADQVAERLWVDADRAAKYSALTAERDRYSADVDRLEKQREEIDRQEADLTRAWQTLWQPAGIDPLPPAEMRSWLGRHEKLVDLIHRCREQEHLRDGLWKEIEDYRTRCRAELTRLDGATEDESLAALSHRAKAMVAAAAEIQTTRRQVMQDLDKAEGELQERCETLAESERAWAGWRERWAVAVRPLGLGANATSDEAETVMTSLNQLFQKLKEGREFRIRIEQIGQDADQFVGDVAELARLCAPDLQQAAVEEVATALVNRLKKGKDDRKDRNNLDKRLRQIRKELDELERDREVARSTLKRLMEEAGVTNMVALEAAERRSQEWHRLTGKLQDLQERLLAEGGSLDELLEQSQGIDPDRLPADIARLEASSAALGEDCARQRETVWRLNSEMEAMDGGSQAADAATEAQTALAEIKSHVETYARLKLSVLLLGREIERYRERNQGPVIQRAGEFFNKMTLGSFTGLSTGFIEGDKVVLLCVRYDGGKVSMEGLSEGTRDQLYLALRLASLEQQAQRGEPMPLVVDDILINFDDRRAEATLALLGELSELTQILFFTHHRQLLALARGAMPRKRFKEHDLDGVEGGHPP